MPSRWFLRRRGSSSALKTLAWVVPSWSERRRFGRPGLRRGRLRHRACRANSANAVAQGSTTAKRHNSGHIASVWAWSPVLKTTTQHQPAGGNLPMITTADAPTWLRRSDQAVPPGPGTMLQPHRAVVIDCETTDLPGAIGGKVGYSNLWKRRKPELPSCREVLEKRTSQFTRQVEKALSKRPALQAGHLRWRSRQGCNKCCRVPQRPGAPWSLHLVGRGRKR